MESKYRCLKSLSHKRKKLFNSIIEKYINDKKKIFNYETIYELLSEHKFKIELEKYKLIGEDNQNYGDIYYNGYGCHPKSIEIKSIEKYISNKSLFTKLFQNKNNSFINDNDEKTNEEMKEIKNIKDFIKQREKNYYRRNPYESNIFDSFENSKVNTGITNSINKTNLNSSISLSTIKNYNINRNIKFRNDIRSLLDLKKENKNINRSCIDLNKNKKIFLPKINNKEERNNNKSVEVNLFCDKSWLEEIGKKENIQQIYKKIKKIENKGKKLNYYISQKEIDNDYTKSIFRIRINNIKRSKLK